MKSKKNSRKNDLPEDRDRPWTKKFMFEKIVPSYFPSILALAALGVALFNGVFEVRSQRQELQKELLQYEITMFENQKKLVLANRDSLIVQNNALRKDRRRTRDLALGLLKDIDQVIKEKKKFPCIEGGILLTEDGKPFTTDDGKTLRLEDAEALNKAIMNLRKKILAASDTTKYFDNTFDNAFH